MAPVAVRPKVDRKQRLRIPAQPIPKQDPGERVHNWEEVVLGFEPEAAIIEATRCIQCPAAPCIKACPVGNDIPGALWLLEQGDFLGAATTFRQTSNLPEMCGRLCPQERLCEGLCVVGKNARPVAIGRLEAFCADYQREHGGVPLPQGIVPSGRRVAVVGSGPAGLAVAEELSVRGHTLTVYEAWPKPGGILRYGIPNFKMAKDLVKAKIQELRQLGVTFVSNTWIGRDLTVDDLLARYHAVFLGTGAGLGIRMGIPGEDLFGIYSATDFLVRGNLTPQELPPQQQEPLGMGRGVAVIGGGDTAMDCVRTALRLGAQEVTCVYRRSEAEMPGRREERIHAREEGVQFEYLTVPVRFLGDDGGRVQAMECQRLKLGEPDASGRPRPLPIPGSEFTVAVDTVVLALGYRADPLVPQTTPGLETAPGELIVVDRATGRTSRPGVFAGGDNVNGADLVVTALAGARRAAQAMDEYLRGLPPLDN